MRTAALLALVLGGMLIAVFAVGWPVAALAQFAFESDWPQAALGERRFTLLLRGVLVAILAAGVAVLLGSWLAVGLATGRRGVRALLTWTGLLTLLAPPYLYAYAWSLTLLPGGAPSGALAARRFPEWLLHEGRAVWCLGTWLTPIAAAILAAGWRRAGRAAYRLTLLDANGATAVHRGLLPVMTPWIGLAMLLTFLLAATEFSVCHLCQVQTLNTEILAEFQNSPPTALALAWPFVALLAVAVGMLAFWRSRLGEFLTDLGALRSVEGEAGGDRASGRAFRLIPAFVVVVALLAPWMLMAARLGDVAAFARIANTFPSAWLLGVAQAALAAAAAGALAIATDAALARASERRAGGGWWAVQASAGAVAFLLLMLAILPPVLVGVGFVRAYAEMPQMRDHLWIASATNVARFGLLALLALRLASRTEHAELSGAARADGAGWAACYWSVRIPGVWRVLLAACTIVGLLSLTEVAASTLVNPPGVPSLALTLLNHVHFGRNDDVIALCLSVFAVVAVVSGSLLLLRRPRSAAETDG